MLLRVARGMFGADIKSDHVVDAAFVALAGWLAGSPQCLIRVVSLFAGCAFRVRCGC